MTAYKVTAASINIHAGILVLTASQAQARMHRLTTLGDNRYDVKDPPVQFKRGEVFEIEGEMDKAIVQSVEDVRLPKVELVKEHKPHEEGKGKKK